MDNNKKFTRQLTLVVLPLISIVVFSSVGLWILTYSRFPSDRLTQVLIWGSCSILLLLIISKILVRIVFKPLKTLSDAIVFAGHNSRSSTAPNTLSLRLGHEMITVLARQVYDLASMSNQTDTISGGGVVIEENLPKKTEAATSFTLDLIGLPVIGIDSNQNLTTLNRLACEYFGLQAETALNKPLYDHIKFSFPTEETFEEWLQDIQRNAVTGRRLWERVRIVDENGKALKQFDLAASFSKDNHTGTETMLIVYDRTDQYNRDDQEISFVSLAVHELRTPLTIMRGYIEVFEDELGPNLTPELKGFMHKMQASAQQLAAFVGNILNIARVEENQFDLKLQKYEWEEVLKRAVEDLALRASVRGKHIELQIAPKLPAVAVDRISIHEVINNLVDNAIKYSDKSDKIVISSILNKDGQVETSIQDFGIGIPAAVMPDLFQKYYRSHKSRVQIGGTGLGLYLCKAIINAHGGNIWVRSKEGEGSIFTFTVQPYDQVQNGKPTGGDGIIRGAHGWIKNHSLYRQ